MCLNFTKNKSFDEVSVEKIKRNQLKIVCFLFKQQTLKVE